MLGTVLFVNVSKAIEELPLFPWEEERCNERHQLYSTNAVIKSLIEKLEEKTTLLMILYVFGGLIKCVG